MRNWTAEGEALSGQVNKALVEEITRRRRNRLLGELLDSMDERLGKIDEALISKYIDLFDLSDAGEHRWSMRALPLIVLGCVLFAMLPGIEIGILAGAQAGADVSATQAAVDTWFVPILVVGGLLYLLGSVGFARAIVSSGLFPSRTASFVAVALVIAAVARFVPLGASLFVGGAALAAALWPVAVLMSRHPVPSP